jgi:uncharacterized surface protein with fasciclin (FAS1) repeats
MKVTFFFRTPILLCALMYLVISGCVKSNTPNTNPNTNSITNIIANSGNATLISSAMIKTGLDSVFNSTGPYTYFVTTDQEFLTAGFSNTIFNSIPDSLLRKIVLYGAVPQQLSASELPAGPNASIQTQSGDSIFVTSNSSGIYVNGTQLATENIIASNGVIHVVGRALLPPTGTILQIAQTDTSFSYFAAAVARASTGTIDISSILSGDPFTVFMPTNTAFQIAGYASINDINNANPDTLSAILEYHILPQRTFTSDFVTGHLVATLLPNKYISCGTLGGGTAFGVTGSGNTSEIVISDPNIVARNGVIHVIGQLLLP